MAGYCSACAAEVLPEAAYCHRCGHRLGGDSQTATEADAPAGASSLTAAAGVSSLKSGGVSDEQGVASQQPELRLWEGGYGYRAVIPVWVLASCVTLLAGGIAISYRGLWNGLFITLVCAVILLGGVGLYLAYRRLSVHYELTSQRFVHQSGLLRRISDRLEVIDIDDVAYGQGPIERLLGVGTIKIISSDRSHPELLLSGIDNVHAVATLIDDARRAERRRHGLFIETV